MRHRVSHLIAASTLSMAGFAAAGGVAKAEAPMDIGVCVPALGVTCPPTTTSPPSGGGGVDVGVNVGGNA